MAANEEEVRKPLRDKFNETAKGDPRLNNSQVSYREVRASAGLSYRFNPTSELILGAGVGLDRRATFNEQRLQLVSRGAPFVRLQYRLRF